MAEEHFRADVQQLIAADAPVDMPPAMDIQALQSAGTNMPILLSHQPLGQHRLRSG